ncbi:histidine phosphatase family protein [Butyrivibrio sp. NC3005]|uniref:histidine phosphatase family protein n=1 Tax=Butyrivibrio sp. NC3005 TaxID=1280685 RepID=UPI00041A407D|nr:histidine phosphatase family protein [Butyrivibrio sp. NC3005]
MIILVIRHGESEADILKVHEGRADFSLTEKGHNQARAMAKYVAENYHINRIYCSTLKRASQTAEHLSRETGASIEYDSDLMEFNNGLLAGLSYEEADRLYPPIENLPIDQSVYNQESKVEFRNRAIKFLDKLLSENELDDCIALVTHGGMVNQLYGAMMHIPIGEKFFFSTSDTGIHVWELTENGCYVRKANLDNHVN